MSSQDNYIVADKIEKMPGGYVVHVRWPYGPSVMNCGPVVCATWAKAVALLTKAAGVERSDDL